MPFCQSCGKEISPDAAFCPYCGHQTGLTRTLEVHSTTASAPQSIDSGIIGLNDIVMKKKILSMREHYDFEDTQGGKLGEGDGNFLQFPAKFQVLDSTNSEVMHIDGKLISLRHEFTFFDNQGNQLGTIKKKLAKLFGSEYWVEQNGVETMRIYGNFVEHDYRFEANNQQVAQVHKKWTSIRDQFGISITGQVDHRLVIGSVIVVEHEEVTEHHR